MKFFIVSIISLLAFSFSGQSFAQASASTPVILSIANTNVTNEYDLVLSARIKSKWQRPIAIPGDFSWGILRYSNFSFLLLEIQKKVGGVFKEVSENRKLDNIPDLSVDSLQYGDSTTTQTFSIADLFSPDKGSYRTRVLCVFSKLNPGMKDIFSNWVYFRCSKDIKLSTHGSPISAISRPEKD
jgi:hypothetical protein